MAAARPFGMEGVNGSPANRRQRIFDKAPFVQRVAVQRHLNVHLFGNLQRAVDRRGRRAPVFVDFQPDSARCNLFAQGVRIRRVAFAQQADIHR
ncbi:hypothetical protein D3C72_909950 [compost metagenome]